MRPPYLMDFWWPKAFTKKGCPADIFHFVPLHSAKNHRRGNHPGSTYLGHMIFSMLGGLQAPQTFGSWDGEVFYGSSMLVPGAKCWKVALDQSKSRGPRGPFLRFFGSLLTRWIRILIRDNSLQEAFYYDTLRFIKTILFQYSKLMYQLLFHRCLGPFDGSASGDRSSGTRPWTQVGRPCVLCCIDYGWFQVTWDDEIPNRPIYGKIQHVPFSPGPIWTRWKNTKWNAIICQPASEHDMQVSSFFLGPDIHQVPFSTKITLLRVIPTMAFNSSHLTIYLAYLSGIRSGMSSDILSGISSDILPGISSDILSAISSEILSVISSDILSGISSDILSGTLSDILSAISSDILSGILSGVSSDILSGISSNILSVISSDILSGILPDILSGISSDILSGTLSDVLSGILSGISFGILSGGWGLAGNTWRGFSRLRSGREHLAWMVAVEVRQGTLGVDSRGWGPAGNTWRGWSRLRSGREHLAWMVAVEVRQGTLGVDGPGWGPEEAEGGGRRQETAGGSQLT